MHLLVLLGIPFTFILNVSSERNGATEETTNAERMIGKTGWKKHILGLSTLSSVQVQSNLNLKAGG